MNNTKHNTGADNTDATTKENEMYDIAITSEASFGATTVEIAPNTEKGTELFSDCFGSAAISAELKKSGMLQFLDLCAEKGVTCG